MKIKIKKKSKTLSNKSQSRIRILNNKSRTKKIKINSKKTDLENLQLLTDKYKIQNTKNKNKIAKTLRDLRMVYLSNKERKFILPFLKDKNTVNHKIFLKLINENHKQKIPIN